MTYANNKVQNIFDCNKELQATQVSLAMNNDKLNVVYAYDGRLSISLSLTHAHFTKHSTCFQGYIYI